MPRRYASSPDGYLPSFGDKLAEFFDSITQGSDIMGRYLAGSEEREDRRQNQALQRLLSYKQLESLDTDRATKHGEFQLKLDEREQARQAKAAQLEQDRKLKTNIPGIFAPVTETVTQQGEQAPSEFGGPGVGEGGKTINPFLKALISRRPNPEERFERAAQAGIDPSAFAKFSKEYREATGETEREKAAQPYTLPPGHERRGPGNELLATGAIAPKEPKPFFEGKSETELEIILRDPSTTPEHRKIAQEALAGIRAAGESKAKAGKTEISFGSAAERQTDVKQSGLLALGNEIKSLAEQNPSFFGGALGYKGAIESAKTKFDYGDPTFARFQASVQRLQADLINALAGAAIGPAEAEYYLKSVPRVGFGGNSSQEFMANLAVTLQNIETLQQKAREMAQQGLPKSNQPGSVPQSGSAPPGFKPVGRP
jgi:hypothetical protein